MRLGNSSAQEPSQDFEGQNHDALRPSLVIMSLKKIKIIFVQQPCVRVFRSYRLLHSLIGPCRSYTGLSPRRAGLLHEHRVSRRALAAFESMSATLIGSFHCDGNNAMQHVMGSPSLPPYVPPSLPTYLPTYLPPLSFRTRLRRSPGSCLKARCRLCPSKIGMSRQACSGTSARFRLESY